MTGLETIIIPPGVTTLSSGIFSGCSKLRKVTTSGVTSIKADAFFECTQLETFTLPDKLVEIGERAFYKCLKLRLTPSNEQIFPGTLNSIGDSAFVAMESRVWILAPQSLRLLRHGSSEALACKPSSSPKHCRHWGMKLLPNARN